MSIRFTSLDRHGRFRTCCWYVGRLEFGLDALSQEMGKGSHLLEAELIDEQGRRTILPTKAFDGVPVSPALQALEQELQDILGSSLDTPCTSPTRYAKKTRS